MAETGSVKFTCELVPVDIGVFAGFSQLNHYRRKLRELGLIGVDATGVGFGNVSIRDGMSSRFYITGSATGRITELKPSDYARVIKYDFASNRLRCEGSTIASSESLTHAAVYESEPTVFSVIHGHDTKLWAALLKMEAPATRKEVQYGTPEMAYAVRNLFKVTDVKTTKIFAMAGHDGGFVAFGRDAGEAFATLIRSRTV